MPVPNLTYQKCNVDSCITKFFKDDALERRENGEEKRDLLNGYKKRKIKLLNDFCIYDADIETFAACNTEKDIDKLAYELITKRLCGQEG